MPQGGVVVESRSRRVLFHIPDPREIGVTGHTLYFDKSGLELVSTAIEARADDADLQVSANLDVILPGTEIASRIRGNPLSHWRREFVEQRQ